MAGEGVVDDQQNEQRYQKGFGGLGDEDDDRLVDQFLRGGTTGAEPGQAFAFAPSNLGLEAGGTRLGLRRDVEQVNRGAEDQPIS